MLFEKKDEKKKKKDKHIVHFYGEQRLLQRFCFDL